MSIKDITERVTAARGGYSPTCNDEDCCGAPRDRETLHTAVTAVLALHGGEDVCDADADTGKCVLCDVTNPPELLRTQSDGGWFQHVHRDRWCAGCDHQTWPCATVQAITTALGES